MPYTIRKIKGGYRVKNTRTKRVVAKKTTKTKAKKQIRLLMSKEKKRY
tara:strand:+ start:118 stop:261 length:144 start_codon:yes stop_codon:yes gene_type:complete